MGLKVMAETKELLTKKYPKIFGSKELNEIASKPIDFSASKASAADAIKGISHEVGHIEPVVIEKVMIEPGAISKQMPKVITKKSLLSRIGTKLKSVGSKIWSGLKTGASKISKGFGKIFKSKGGKIGLTLAALAALVYAGKKVYDNYNENKTPSAVVDNQVQSEEQMGEVVVDEQALTPEETEKLISTAETDENKDNGDNVDEIPKVHNVVKGDNVWNIAKKHLKDMKNNPNYEPSDAEVLKHTKELMELNDLHFEADGYHVMIRPKDTIKLVA